MNKKLTDREKISQIRNGDYFLSNIRSINNESEEVKLAFVKYCPEDIDYIKNPSEKVQLAAVNEDGEAIQFIKNPSDKVKLVAVNKNGFYISYIKNPSEKVQLAAVRKTPSSFYSINGPFNENVMHTAIKKDINMLQGIFTTSETDELLIPESLSIELIKNEKDKSKKSILKIFTECNIKLTRKMKLAYLRKNGSKLKLTKDERNFFLDNISGVPIDEIKEFEYEGEFILTKEKEKIIKSLEIKFGKIK